MERGAQTVTSRRQFLKLLGAGAAVAAVPALAIPPKPIVIAGDDLRQDSVTTYSFNDDTDTGFYKASTDTILIKDYISTADYKAGHSGFRIDWSDGTVIRV